MTDSAALAAEPLVITEVRGHTGFILLNRPKAINALNREMVRIMQETLTAWAGDDSVRQVVVHGTGERGFCAGGDIVSIYKDGKAGNVDAPREFFTAEYQLDHLTSEYPKPYIALMDGLTLGGGVGISAHGGVRIVTDRTKLGMPETGIGFLPDVGATLLLSNAPGETGTYLALTGEMVSGADAIFLGLADVFVPAERLEDLTKALETEDVDDAVARFSVEPPASALAERQEWIDSAFSSDSPLSIVESLEAEGSEEAKAAAETIRSKSPTSTCVTLALLRRNKGLTLREALDEELRVGMNLFRVGEMTEGVRAQVIDKDRNPAWNPATLEEITPERVAEILEDSVPAAK